MKSPSEALTKHTPGLRILACTHTQASLLSKYPALLPFWELKLGFPMGQVSRPGPGAAPGSLASLSQHLPFCSWFPVIVDGPTSSPGPHTILEPACQHLCLQFSQAWGQALPGFGV